ncbi:MAG: hypothetical protein IJ598_00155 [Ruminococcus sp.]|nr:hypothetical protein [Ruminococcus sp.]
MQDCFRFLINTDQCLKMSNFDIFFYKLRSRDKLHVSEVQLFGDDFATSLRGAMGDIRSYLNKYPYMVGDFHMIVATRVNYGENTSAWKKTILCRLMQLYCESNAARVYINSKERNERTLSLLMLYDADFSAQLQQLDDYLSGARLAGDCRLLFAELGVGEQDDLRTLDEALRRYAALEAHDEATVAFLGAFLERHRAELEGMERICATADSDISVAGDSYVFQSLLSFLPESFANYQVFETYVDKNNQRETILSLLRIVEFINLSTARDDGEVTRLPDAVRRNWQQASRDAELEHRYAKMLYAYQKRLEKARADIEDYKLDYSHVVRLPAIEIPAESEIQAHDGSFTESKGEHRYSRDMRKKLEVFRARGIVGKDILERWDKLYTDTNRTLEDMDLSLRRFAQDLSHTYSGVIEKRSREHYRLSSAQFAAEESTAREAEDLEYERDKIYNRLRSPRMDPALRFQDRLNMSASLEQENKNIRYCVRCLKSVTALNLILLAVGITALTAVHYTLLQPYVFENTAMVFHYFVYLMAIFALMILSWGIPRHFFRKKIKDSIDRLLQNLDTYAEAYYDKAHYFVEYINLLNRLDYITRSHSLRRSALERSATLTKGCLWHKVQIDGHLNKLKFFHGLIGLCHPDEVEIDELPASPLTENGSISDVTDSPIYRPQG